ncbi:MAG: hypothetical protein ACTHMD_11975 [Flavisolibacter sp.]
MLYQYLLTITVAILFFATAKAQDTLVLNDGTEMYVKVLEIKESTLSYKKTENITGPTYETDLGKIFMAIYKGGKRESFIKSDTSASEKQLNAGNATDHPKAIAVIFDKNFEVRLTAIHTEPDKKNKFLTISAAVDAYVNGKLFTSMALATRRALKPQGEGATTITVAVSEKLQKLLWEKYESYSGKGYRWDLPPGFFSMDAAACSIRFYQQKNGNKEILGFGGLSYTSMGLKDCSSLENKLLSVALLWLETNFGK